MFPSFDTNKLPKKANNNQRSSTQSDEKYFYVQHQTFYHHYFKKIKPTQIIFKQNSPTTNRILNQTCSGFKLSWKQRFSNIEKEKIVQKMMKIKKGGFQQQLNKNMSKINSSFNRYIEGKTNEQGTMNQQRKKTLSCKNILKQLKQMQSIKKLNLPLVNVNQKNLLEIASQTNCQIFPLQSNCLDTMFPFQRYGAAMTTYQNELLLYGGFSQMRKPLVSCFHKYSIENKMWTRVQETTKALSMIPCFHTIDVYKNYMILVGGVSITPQNGKRKFNSDICIYNFQKKEWSKLRSSLSIRSHASTLFGNTLLIHGGIDQKQSNSNQMHFINFNSNSIQNSIILTTQNRQISNQFQNSLSHHKLVNTNEIDQNLKMLLKYDGVFCFGGTNQDNVMHNNITFLNCIGKENALDVRFQSWVQVQLIGKGPKPQARKNHSFNIINKKASIILIGGQNQYGQFLSDIWIFDLIKLEWRQINPISSPFSSIISDSKIIKFEKLEDTISGHCATFMASRLYIFGGKRSAQNKKDNCLWCIETDIVNNLNKKLKIEKSINTSINTIKQSNKQESMWNIEF